MMDAFATEMNRKKINNEKRKIAVAMNLSSR